MVVGGNNIAPHLRGRQQHARGAAAAAAAAASLVASGLALNSFAQGWLATRHCHPFHHSHHFWSSQATATWRPLSRPGLHHTRRGTAFQRAAPGELEISAAPNDEKCQGTRTFAVLTSRFRNSACMWCGELEITLDPRKPEALEDYVAGFFPKAPSSGLALEGLLREDGGCDSDPESGSDAVLDFRVLAAHGQWPQQQGDTEGNGPRLQRLRFRWSVDESARQLLDCKGLALPSSALSLPVPSDEITHGESGPRPGTQTLNFLLDTGKAYHWMRFGGYLHWARYIIDAITAAAPEPGSLVLDLGGGSGWMAALLRAHLGPSCDVLCTDLAEEALDLARENFAKNRLSVATAQGDLFEPVRQRGPPLPSFIFFYPPQDPSTSPVDAWRGSPDVSLRAPSGEAVHFHARFCHEAILAPGGRAWLAVDWALLPEVAGICCGAGWEVELPEAVRDVTSAPSALVELRKAKPGHDVAGCIAHAGAQVEQAAEFQIRALGMREDDLEGRAASYRKAAERGFSGGQLNLGSVLASGAGVEQDKAAAATWFYKAAQAGEAKAQLNLGVLLAQQGAEEAAAEWYQKAAEQGHEKAQRHLARLYSSSKLPLSSNPDALRWIRKAAGRGDFNSQVLLAKLCLKGQHVEQSYKEAASWLRRAAATAEDGQEAETLLQAAVHLEEKK